MGKSSEPFVPGQNEGGEHSWNKLLPSSSFSSSPDLHHNARSLGKSAILEAS